MLTVGKDISGPGIFLRTKPVDIRRIGNGNNLVHLHNITTDTGYTGVGLVIDKDIAAIIGTVGERHMRMMGITIHGEITLVSPEFLFPGQHIFHDNFTAFVGPAPSGGAAPVKDRNTHQFPHGRNTDNTNLAGLATTPETVIIVKVTGGNFVLALGLCSLGQHAPNTDHADPRRKGRAAQHGASGKARLLGFFCHISLLFFK